MLEGGDAAAASALHTVSHAGASLSSISLAEAVPGFMTPLCASVWVPASALRLWAPFAAMGVLPGDQAGIPQAPRRRGTSALHTSDVIRIDGAAGTVEILQRIGAANR